MTRISILMKKEIRHRQFMARDDTNDPSSFRGLSSHPVCFIMDTDDCP